MAAPDGAARRDLDNIPALTSISPSIFVPTERDFTKTPPPISDDPVTRLEETLEALDWHAARVEDNMVAMLVREAQRVRQVGGIEHAHYLKNRQVKDCVQLQNPEKELILEERILRQGAEMVLKGLKGKRPREDDDQKDPYERRPPTQPRNFSSSGLPPSESSDPQYADLATLRRERLMRVDVDERQSPRSVALTFLLNLVKWGWDEQLEGHRGAVEREKEERRAALARMLRENPSSLTTTASIASAPQPRPTARSPPPRPRIRSPPPQPESPNIEATDADKMDLD
ncbi:hypothetical protein GGR50DRAFT_59428 [Xylaria sp. CBS 124048]|nr:hypothetical protein GGR50DRAFT_59428 [Xylaria sp. CBS 124048]